MSKEVGIITSYTCNGCGATETIGGEYPEAIMDEKCWVLDEFIFACTVDLCPDCANKVKTVIGWKEPEVESVSVRNYTITNTYDENDPNCTCPGSTDPNCPSHGDPL